MFGQHYPVRDLSMRSFSVYLGDSPKTPVTPSGPVAITMIVDAKPIELTAELRHCSGAQLGFEIVKGAPTWAFAVARLLAPERLGRSLEAIPLPGVMAPEFGGAVQGFVGTACSLWIWSNAQARVVAARLFFGDDVVEWFLGRATKSGRRPASFSVGPAYGKADSLQLHSPADPAILQVAMAVLKQAKLPDALATLVTQAPVQGPPIR